MSKERDLLKEVINAYNGSSVALIELVISEVVQLLSEPESNGYHQGYQDGKAFAGRHGEISPRDHFAGLAMQGFLTADEDHLIDENDIAEWAYDQADAMLKERSAEWAYDQADAQC